ncbi:ribonuclease E/G [Mesorhizobium amorphae]|uniref:Rne/Rng family ribonuclease n=1 Tax=Mesorhizobium amorphae TaxID=71433 RepID=UPI0011829558|nr:ribonuclease E/G [Mesorhizobium amorphae]
MPNKMLIDASHPEETRVVVVRGNRIEEFDFESQDKKQLKGNIYLARVTRVEPSLQAAFVEYGGNRHGFLAFSEIHPDYYQIPVADRQALLRAEAQEHEDEEDEENGENGDDRQERNRGRRGRRRGRNRDRGERKRDAAASENDETSDEAVAADENADDVETVEPNDNGDADEGTKGGSIAASVEVDVISEEVDVAHESREEQPHTSEDNHGDEVAPAADADRGTLEEVPSSHSDDHEIESVGAEDALEEIRDRRRPVRKQYKIQEVIKRRQILLVQVVKEERGNKGAALTTYLSLAGRYSVLMPNTARGGGISRKITNAQDRKRLKEVVADLEVPQGMGVILRTAGESRTKAEIKRDYEYLMRLWENVRNLTLKSTAPALVYEEGSLIKRSVRDLYNKEIDEILVAGEDGYREAKDFMRMLMPSHAKMVQPYRDTSPIFARNGIEAQLDKMLQPQVTLKSGGYLIINQTEALVSIDVNSGRSTREHSIEDTALQTNLEAAEEVARQLRLRDLAGLIVIDFIDMEENRNNRAVEKKLKDCLKNDRARIQVGRISHFGLMEMSRQRIRASVLESTMKPCPHCGGTGHVRSDSSVALLVVRAIEEFLLKDSRSHITVRTPAATALYVLNHKRSTLVELETRFGLTITVEADETVGSQHYTIARGAIAEKPEGFVEMKPQPIPVEPEEPEDEIIVEDEEEAGEDQPRQEQQQAREGDSQRDRKRRRRRRRRGGRDRDQAATEAGNDEDTAADDEDASEESDAAVVEAAAEVETIVVAEENDDEPAKKRRRGKRGGKRSRKEDGETADDAAEAATADSETVTAEVVAEAAVVEPEPAPAVEEAPAEKPKKPRRTAKSKKAEAAAAEAAVVEVTTETAADIVVEPAPSEAKDAPAGKKPRASRRKAASAETPAAPVVSSTTAAEAEEAAEEKPKRGGWWQRKGFF